MKNKRENKANGCCIKKASSSTSSSSRGLILAENVREMQQWDEGFLTGWGRWWRLGGTVFLGGSGIDWASLGATDRCPPILLRKANGTSLNCWKWKRSCSYHVLEAALCVTILRDLRSTWGTVQLTWGASSCSRLLHAGTVDESSTVWCLGGKRCSDIQRYTRTAVSTPDALLGPLVACWEVCCAPAPRLSSSRGLVDSSAVRSLVRE